mgnify:CR=1 FL=1
MYATVVAHLWKVFSGRRHDRNLVLFPPQIIFSKPLRQYFAGLGDNRVLAHEDWLLFGLEREDVLAEFKRLALRGLFIIQAAGEVVKIHWPYKSMDEVIHAVTQGEF